MKICIFTDTYYPQINGVASSVHTTALALLKNGHEVTVFVPKLRGHKTLDLDTIGIYSLKFPFLPDEARIPIVLPSRNLLKLTRFDYDVVHAHGNGFFSLLALEVAKLHKKHFVLTFHTLWPEYTHYVFRGKVLKPRMVKFALKILANRCDGVVTPSEKMKNALVSYGVKRPIEILPNFVDMQKFNSTNREYLHIRLDIPKDHQILLSVGRLGKEKNFEFVIRVFQKLLVQRKNVHLVLVGDGPDKKRLQTIVKKLQIENRVHFTGFIAPSILPAVYSSSDIFVFASTTETQGLCVLEAASSGLPLVLVDDAAFNNMINNGKNGYVLPLKEEEFVEKISVLFNDNKLRKRFGRHSRKLISEKFEQDVIVKKLVDFYATF